MRRRKRIWMSSPACEAKELGGGGSEGKDNKIKAVSLGCPQAFVCTSFFEETGFKDRETRTSKRLNRLHFCCQVTRLPTVVGRRGQ